MDEALQNYLLTVEKEVRAVAISDHAKQVALSCIGQMPALYTELCASYESRYCDQITNLFQAVLKELTESSPICLEARALAEGIPNQLRLVHEQGGLPGLPLKVRVPKARPGKVKARP